MVQFIITFGFLAGTYVAFLAISPGKPANPIC